MTDDANFIEITEPDACEFAAEVAIAQGGMYAIGNPSHTQWITLVDDDHCRWTANDGESAMFFDEADAEEVIDRFGLVDAVVEWYTVVKL